MAHIYVTKERTEKEMCARYCAHPTFMSPIFLLSSLEMRADQVLWPPPHVRGCKGRYVYKECAVRTVDKGAIVVRVGFEMLRAR